ncbi:DUF4174 domain-containing protein [Paracoccus sanguinis]|uniref:DUF4174 domain-containing protein n=1 Tax=Paracoccus sanguinis TaxID=1545044 RepID=UPI001E379062|nr:DUF4174 domain-containing protein [Paracoccus sanguinis]
MIRDFLGRGRVARSVAAAGPALLACGVAVCGAGAWAMGAPTPPPAPVHVERAPPARPAHDAPLGTAEPRRVPLPDRTVELEYLLARDITPEELLFRRRVVVVFADTPADPAFTAQMVALETQAGPLVERDVVVVADSDPADATVWRQRLKPNGFSLLVIDKDGQVKQRKPSPWDVREIVRAIDKFPLRRQEIGRMGVMP